ncbi:MAG: single-stranded DNA-binding protein [Scardovia wiggsiae]|uniref:single-stranded DNA-binding protein n=1 Tax=Scardovia wiggsiae TaxID=230143 RepID=UPI001CB5CD60|nr:single-stranded DNA-binding protein [Scardovia wiggsiae]
MAGETPITIVGNLTADPELRTTGNGGTVVNFTIASTPRTYNRNSGQWEDGDALFLRCSCWDSQYSPMATNISQSLSKGMRVIAQGNLTQRSYQTQSGESRTVVELRVNEIGPALSRNTAQVQRNASSSGFSGGSSNSGGFSGGNRGGYQGGATQANASNANSGDFLGNGGGFASQGGDPWANSSDTDSFNSGAAFGSGNDFGSNDEFADPEF